MASTIGVKRLMKESAEIQKNGCPPGIEAIKTDSFEEWIFTVEVLGETLYEGEKFALRLRFDSRYPMEAPQVVFIVDKDYSAPIHPHVYSNGHICASILGDKDWTPALQVIGICMTIQSMLASCKKKERPTTNDSYVRTAPLNPKLTRWHYDDDTV